MLQARLGRTASVRPRDAKSTSVRPAALPFLDKFREFFTPNQTTSPVQLARDELLEELLSSTPDNARVSELVDDLAESRVPFREQLLGGGPWQVRYTKGSPQLWRETWRAGKVFNGANVASQDFSPQGRLAVNKAEYLGKSLYVTASGTYEPVDDTASLPKTIQTTIRQGNLHVLGLDVPLPIRGAGWFDILYLDDQIRIFGSNGSFSVQVRADVLATADA